MNAHLLLGIVCLVISTFGLAWCLLRGGKWLGWLLAVVAFCGVVVMAGCAIDRSASPLSDWPELRMFARAGYAPECVGFVGGCAIPRFCEKRCDVYLFFGAESKTLTASEAKNLCMRGGSILAHEACHCVGYDHYGENTMRMAWENYKKMDGPRFCELKVW